MDKVKPDGTMALRQDVLSDYLISYPESCGAMLDLIVARTIVKATTTQFCWWELARNGLIAGVIQILNLSVFRWDSALSLNGCLWCLRATMLSFLISQHLTFDFSTTLPC